MEEYKDKIRQCAVRIRVCHEVGSGFLFIPEEGTYAYIFTVFHVIKRLVTGKETTNFEIALQNEKLNCSISDLEFCVLDVKNSEGVGRLAYDDYKKINVDKYCKTSYEAAVIRISKSLLSNIKHVPKIRLWMSKNSIKKDEKFLCMGYPNGNVNPLKLSGEYIGPSNEKNLLEYQSQDGNYDNFVDAIEGFSGSGIVMLHNNENLVLTGLVLKCKDREANRVFRAVCLDEIMECMRTVNWDYPKECQESRIPESFMSPDIEQFLNKDMHGMDRKTRTCVNRCLYELSMTKRPVELAEKEHFYDIPKCEMDRRICSQYWEGKLWQLFMEMFAEETAGKNYYVTSSGEKISFAFICSEGDGKSDIGTVVESAVKSGTLGDQIKGDCILLWQSNWNPRKRFLPKGRFENIVEDITYGGDDTEKKGFHLLNGEMRGKGYGILHRTYLVDRIDGCQTIDEIRQRIKEVIDEIW